MSLISDIVCIGEFGSLAQLGERLPYKQDVTGSSPVTPTIFGTFTRLTNFFPTLAYTRTRRSKTKSAIHANLPKIRFFVLCSRRSFKSAIYEKITNTVTHYGKMAR